MRVFIMRVRQRTKPKANAERAQPSMSRAPQVNHVIGLAEPMKQGGWEKKSKTFDAINNPSKEGWMDEW